MTRPRGSTTPFALVFAVAVFAGCTTSTDDGTIVLPIADVQRSRELQLEHIPPVKRLTREEYAVMSEKRARDATDEHQRTQRDAYGRLGFFALDFDPRSTARTTSAFYGAFYSNADKDITVIGSPTPSLLVHELTHALQDQRFDLTRLFEESKSSDEGMAQRGLIEGDAVMSAYRYETWTAGFDPTAAAAEQVTPTAARAQSERILDKSTVPLIFVGLQAFAYSYGAAYVATVLQTQRGSWSYYDVNRLLGDRGPVSTQEVLLAGAAADPIVPAGLAALPADVAADYSVETVDRMGEWYTYLLLRPVADPVTVRGITTKWDGDQLLLLRKKDGAAGIVWTTVWDDVESAATIADYLRRLHTNQPHDAYGPYAFTARDGEPLWVEQRENQVCFAKNFAQATMDHLAHVALSTKEERRLEILRVVASQPIVH
jgi:hypothetical protein